MRHLEIAGKNINDKLGDIVGTICAVLYLLVLPISCGAWWYLCLGQWWTLFAVNGFLVGIVIVWAVLNVVGVGLFLISNAFAPSTGAGLTLMGLELFGFVVTIVLLWYFKVTI